MRRLALGIAAMTGLNKIWKDKYITITTKRTIVNALVFPVVRYGSESWTIRKAERTIIDSFDRVVVLEKSATNTMDCKKN